METDKKYSRKALQSLLFRRQFILAPYFITNLSSWKRVNVNNSTHLTLHPDLEVYQAVRGNKSITLLGYILDPNNPEANNADIISSLIKKLITATDFFKYTSQFGGRWILIVNDGRHVILFHDAAGLRQVFYSYSSSSSFTWCASQPGLLAEVLDLEIDQKAYEFMNSDEYKNNGHHWWPGDTSPYREIRHLLPNHYLDLHTGSACRYWPNKNLEELSLPEAIRKSSQILRAMIQSAYNRFDLALSLTAGWDSRLILAATRPIAYDVFHFTSIYSNLTENSTDVIVPGRLLLNLGINHNIIKSPKYINQAFKRIYQRNVSTAHDIYCAFTQAIYEQYPINRVCMKGDASEIAKCYFRLHASNRQKITAQDLASLSDMGVLPFVTKAFEKWLSTLDAYNIHVLDLFSWEQDVGNCVAMIQTECDIVHESFSPFNCRNLLTTMLSVHEKHRQLPHHQLYRNLIQNLWAETLSEPVNPPKNKTMDDIIVEILVKGNLYQFIPKPMKRLGKKLLNVFQ